MSGSFIEPVKVKDGNIDDNEKLVDEDEFESILHYALKKAKESAENIIDAKIPITPYLNSGNTPCRYCSYKSFCKFSTDFVNNKYRNITTKQSDDILLQHKNNAEE